MRSVLWRDPLAACDRWLCGLFKVDDLTEGGGDIVEIVIVKSHNMRRRLKRQNGIADLERTQHG